MHGPIQIIGKVYIVQLCNLLSIANSDEMVRAFCLD